MRLHLPVASESQDNTRSIQPGIPGGRRVGEGDRRQGREGQQVSMDLKSSIVLWGVQHQLLPPAPSLPSPALP